MTQQVTEVENPRAWMKSCCAWDRGPLIDSPFLVDFEGETYEAATTGHGIVFVRGAGVTTRRNGPEGADRFLSRLPVDLGKVDVADLVQWGVEVECRCGTCDFAGVVEERHAVRSPFNFGRFYGRLFNRWLFFQFLKDFRCEATVLGSNEPMSHVQVIGDGWLVAIMPCRDDGEPGIGSWDPFPAVPPLPTPGQVVATGKAMVAP